MTNMSQLEEDRFDVNEYSKWNIITKTNKRIDVFMAKHPDYTHDPSKLRNKEVVKKVKVLALKLATILQVLPEQSNTITNSEVMVIAKNYKYVMAKLHPDKNNCPGAEDTYVRINSERTFLYKLFADNSNLANYVPNEEPVTGEPVHGSSNPRQIQGLPKIFSLMSLKDKLSLQTDGTHIEAASDGSTFKQGTPEDDSNTQPRVTTPEATLHRWTNKEGTLNRFHRWTNKAGTLIRARQAQLTLETFQIEHPEYTHDHGQNRLPEEDKSRLARKLASKILDIPSETELSTEEQTKKAIWGYKLELAKFHPDKNKDPEVTTLYYELQKERSYLLKTLSKKRLTPHPDSAPESHFSRYPQAL